MTTLEQLETKIRQSIPELEEEYEVFQEGAIDADMITPIMLNHVLEYINKFNSWSWSRGIDTEGYLVHICDLFDGNYNIKHEHIRWNIKSAYLKDQSEELINFLNELK